MTELRKFWPSALALATAIITTSLSYHALRAQRFSNLEIDASGFPSTYLVFSKSDPERCYVVGRRDATMRRSDNQQPGLRWYCFPLSTNFAGSASVTWLLKSKRIGAGTVFLVPALDVQDWAYPFLYSFVREHRDGLQLPQVSWTQLYTDRVYRGVYLRVALPFDKRIKDGGSGILRELLVVRGEELFVVNTRSIETRKLYVSAAADGIFLNLAPPPPALAWLARRAPTAGTTFLVSNLAPNDLSLLPLPVSLPELYQLENGRRPPTFRDSRYRQWSHGSWRTEIDPTSPFTEGEWAQLRSEFEVYAARLRDALRAQAALDLSHASVESALGARQAAIADLQLSLGTL